MVHLLSPALFLFEGILLLDEGELVVQASDVDIPPIQGLLGVSGLGITNDIIAIYFYRLAFIKLEYLFY